MINENRLLKYALFLGKSFRIFQLPGVNLRGQCDCFKKEKCPHPGKHPLKPGWQQSASQNPGKIAAWWKENPNANIGVLLTTDHIVIDIDPKNGGDISLAIFEKEHGALPITAEVITGSGGRHLFYKRPVNLKNIKIKNRAIMKGVDCKTHGGLVVGLGSKHSSGRYYEEGPLGFDEACIMELNHKVLLDLLVGDPAKDKTKKKDNSLMQSPQFFDVHVGEGSRHNTMFTIGCSMRGRGFSSSMIFKALQEINKTTCNPPLVADEIFQISTSIDKYPVGAAAGLAPSLSEQAKCLIGPVGAIAKKLRDETEASIVAILVQILTIIGNVVGRKLRIENGNINFGLNLYAVLIGKTSRGRKGTSFQISKEICEKFIPNDYFRKISSGLASGEGLIHAVRDPVTKYVKGKELTDDVGVIDKRLLIYEPEVSKVFRVSKREANTLSQTLREAYDGNDLQNLSKNSPERSTQPHVSLIGHITPHEINHDLDTNSMLNGLGNRILWIHVERTKLLPHGGRKIDFSSEVKLLKPIFEMQKISGIVRISKDAKGFWEEIYTSKNSQADSPSELLDALKARSTDLIIKVAGLYAVIENVREISIAHLEAALELWDYCEKSIDYIFSKRFGSGITEDEKLLEKIKLEGQLSRTAIRDFFNKNKTATEIEEIGTRLVQKGLIKIKVEGATEYWSPASSTFLNDLRPNDNQSVRN